MQETINFEIGGQTYKLIGNNKEMTAKAANLVNNRFTAITSKSAAASNREIAFMLTALNLAEEQLNQSETAKLDEESISNEVNRIINYVQNEISKLVQ